MRGFLKPSLNLENLILKDAEGLPDRPKGKLHDEGAKTTKKCER